MERGEVMKKIGFYSILLIISLLFNWDIYAENIVKQELMQKPGIYVYQVQEEPTTYMDPMVWIQVPLQSEITMKEQVYNTIESLFQWSNTEDLYSCIPQGTSVLSVVIEKDQCILNISQELIQYGGGTYIEKMIVEQLCATVFSFPQIQKVTILIEGMFQILPEGTEIQEIERKQWEENQKEVTQNGAVI